MATPSVARPVRARVARSPLIAVMALLLAGCAAGPNFRPPAAPAVGRYTTPPVRTTVAARGVAGGAPQRFEPGRDIPGDWWTVFHSAPLDALVGQSLRNNPDLKAARAALLAAHEQTLAQRGAFLPSAAASFSASRNGQSVVLAPVPNYPAVPNEFEYSLFTPQLVISYAPDLFGLERRTAESFAARERAAQFQMIAAWVTLTSNVVVAAIERASLEAQIRATRQVIRANVRMLAILRYQLAKGYASGLDVAAQEGQLAHARATLPPLVEGLAQQRDLLAVLVGRFPDEAPASRLTLASLTLPRELPLTLPSKLVEQRPDVREAQANLHAASAAIGIAAAQRLPQIELTADAGSTALAISKVFSSGTGFWGIAASLAAPIFQGGALLHQERAAKAAYVAAANQYRSTVLSAFRNVADTLVAIQADAAALRAAAVAERADKTALDLATRRLRDGYDDSLDWLNAEQSYDQARIASIQAAANRFADTAALYQALGGGWWHQAALGK